MGQLGPPPPAALRTRAGALHRLQHRRDRRVLPAGEGLRPPREAAVAALAPEHLRGSAFGLLATVQAGGNVIACTIAGLLYTVASPAVAFGYVAACMALALATLAWAAKPTPFVSAQSDR